MSTSLKSDFVIYHEQFWGGVVETLQQNTDAFNAASANCIRLVLRDLKGDYEKESFLKSTASLISRRDLTSVSAATAVKMAQGEIVGVKLARKLGPVEVARDAWRKIGVDPAEFSFMLGVQAAPAMAIDYIDTALAGARAAIKNNSAVLYDATGDTLKTNNHTALVSGMQKFGDRASRLSCFVMHSKPYFDLMKQQIADKLYEVAGATVYAGTIATFGKPVVVLDSASLYTSASTPTYDVLMLVQNAVEVAESEGRDILAQPVTGLENLVDRIQGEYSFNLKIKGYTYVTGSGDNPNAAAVATGSNWTKIAADDKLTAGVAIKFQ